MILVKTIWDRLQDYAKKYQSGFDSVAEFNGKLNEAQVELQNNLLPFYEDNDRVKLLLDPFTFAETATTDASGIFPKPENYRKTLSVLALPNEASFPVFPAQVNEIPMYSIIPQREPSLEKKNAYYVTIGDNFQFYPQQAFEFAMVYLTYAPEAKIVFTYEEDSLTGEDVMVLDTEDTVNLVWSDNAFNLLLYMMLDKYGISSRELLLSEYAKLGIQTEVATVAN